MSKKAVRTPRKKAKNTLVSSQLKDTVISRSDHLPATVIVPPRKQSAETPRRSPRPGRRPTDPMPATAIAAPRSQSGGRTASRRVPVGSPSSLSYTLASSEHTSRFGQPLRRMKLGLLTLLILSAAGTWALMGPGVHFYHGAVSRMESWFDWRTWAQHLTEQRNVASPTDGEGGSLLPEKDLGLGSQGTVTPAPVSVEEGASNSAGERADGNGTSPELMAQASSSGLAGGPTAAAAVPVLGAAAAGTKAVASGTKAVTSESQVKVSKKSVAPSKKKLSASSKAKAKPKSTAPHAKKKHKVQAKAKAQNR